MTRGESKARQLRCELFDDRLLDELIAATTDRGIALTGEGGFLLEMIKAVLERDIQHHLAVMLGTEFSHETISKVIEAVAEEVTGWQARVLESFYPVVHLDALVVKVRDRAHVANRLAHIAVGVDGIKHVPGIWVQATEGAKFWAGVCANLANRGVAPCHDPDVCGAPDRFLDAVHGLPGSPQC